MKCLTLEVKFFSLASDLAEASLTQGEAAACHVTLFSSWYLSQLSLSLTVTLLFIVCFSH